MPDKRSLIKELVKKGEVHLVLFRGFKEKDNQPFHAFIVMNGYELDKLKLSKTVVPGQYGEVLYSNYGHDVPGCIADSVLAGFKKRFNLN